MQIPASGRQPRSHFMMHAKENQCVAHNTTATQRTKMYYTRIKPSETCQIDEINFDILQNYLMYQLSVRYQAGIVEQF